MAINNIVDSFLNHKSILITSKNTSSLSPSLGTIALFISDDFDFRSIRSADFNPNLNSQDLNTGFKNIFKQVYIAKSSYTLSQLLHSKLLESTSSFINKYLLNSKMLLGSLVLGLVINLVYYTILKYHFYPINALIIVSNYFLSYLGTLIVSLAVNLRK